MPDPNKPARVVSINGEIVPPERATVSVYDRGFLYGDAVFEVLRTYGQRPFALAEHMERLARSAASVFIPMALSAEELATEVERTLGAAGNRESYARIMLSRGQGVLGLDVDLVRTVPTRVILVEPVSPYPREHYASGIELAIVATTRTVDETSAAGAKVSNYMASLLALREAKLRGASEVLIMNGRGEVTEGATSNLFLVRDGRLITPPASSGILAGITRAAILASARELGIETQEVRVVPGDIFAADELFITSSIREVVPVVRVDGRTIRTGEPGPITRRLHRAFFEKTGVVPERMPWEALAE